MCRCTPSIRTPFCGKPGCEWPAYKDTPIAQNLVQKAEQELLACPFCGSLPKIFVIGNEHTKSREVKVKCPECRCERTIGAVVNGIRWLLERSVEHWNKRI